MVKESINVHLTKLVSPNNNILWLNSKFLLSDLKENDWCDWDINDEETGINTQNEKLPSFLVSLLIKSLKFNIIENCDENNKQFKDEFLEWLSLFEKGLWRAYKHQVQGTQQNLRIQKLKENLKENEAILHIDYAMKVLPMRQKFILLFFFTFCLAFFFKNTNVVVIGEKKVGLQQNKQTLQ